MMYSFNVVLIEEATTMLSFDAAIYTLQAFRISLTVLIAGPQTGDIGKNTTEQVMHES